MPDFFATEVMRRAAVPVSEFEWLKPLTKVRSIGRRDAFCRLGQTNHEVGFVEKGIFQVYQLTEEGEHVVLDFLFPGDFALALTTAAKGEPSGVSIDAVTPCVVRAWPYALRLEANARHSEWARFETMLVEEAFIRKQNRYQALLTMSAQRRYAMLDTEFTPLWKEIPQHLLASYLHVTPQYLSRLKRVSVAPLRGGANSAN